MNRLCNIEELMVTDDLQVARDETSTEDNRLVADDEQEKMNEEQQ